MSIFKIITPKSGEQRHKNKKLFKKKNRHLKTIEIKFLEMKNNVILI